MMFLGFFSGYMIGQIGLGLNREGCLILSLVVGIGTIIMEAVLMIYRLHKQEQTKEYKLEKQKMEFDILNRID